MTKAGFEVMGDRHIPICPVRFKDELSAQKISEGLMDQGILVTSLTYPEVPKNESRIRN